MTPASGKRLQLVSIVVVVLQSPSVVEALVVVVVNVVGPGQEKHNVQKSLTLVLRRT